MYIHTEQLLTVKYGMAKRYKNVENEVEEHKIWDWHTGGFICS